MSNKLKVVVVGCGHMGSSHARAYNRIDDFELVGLVARTPEKASNLAAELGGIPVYSDLGQALQLAQPDVVSINTYPDTHAALAEQSMRAGAHVFVEKPLALTVNEAKRVVDLSLSLNKKMVVGYILRVHPAWQKFIEVAQGLGKPLVMRMNLNQQNDGPSWERHKKIMESMSPIVDCGVHYVDVMCQMTRSKPKRVYAIGARLSEELQPGMYNYGQLQVVFADESVGWYEAGWGPMISETAYFVKDVVGPQGCVSFVDKSETESDDIGGHTDMGRLRIHKGELAENGGFKEVDQFLDNSSDPDHDALCELEQRFLLKAITDDLSLKDHLEDAINSLQIVLAADESIKTGAVIQLQ